MRQGTSLLIDQMIYFRLFVAKLLCLPYQWQHFVNQTARNTQNFIWKAKVYIQYNAIEMSSVKWQPFSLLVILW